MEERPQLNIGITCYPLIGGSGILATALGSELAQRGHRVHFFSSALPVRLDLAQPGIWFHEVVVNEYSLFTYPDYTLPLAVRMAEVARAEALDVFHVHYAVPHATAAYLAVQMLIYLAIPALLICTFVVLRWLRDPGERRAALVSNARVALWLGLTVALPANLAFAWLSGVSLFCF